MLGIYTKFFNHLKPRVQVGQVLMGVARRRGLILPLTEGELWDKPMPVGEPVPIGTLGWLTGQLAPERRVERLGPGGTMPLGERTMPVGAPVPLREEGELWDRPMPVGEPVPLGLMEPPPISPQTDLGARPELGEWFKKNRTLVIVIVVALILLFFFLKKRRR